MGVNDWGQPDEDLADPALSAWAASVAQAFDQKDTSVDARIAAAAEVAIQPTAPPLPSALRLWVNSANGVVSWNNGTAWQATA